MAFLNVLWLKFDQIVFKMSQVALHSKIYLMLKSFFGCSGFLKGSEKFSIKEVYS